MHRNRELDFMRFVGISAIILAHVEPPSIVFQLRNFDVPLIVIAAAVSYKKYSSQARLTWKRYIYYRFVRLVFSTWLFLFIYNAISFLIESSYSLSAKSIALQLFLIGGTDVGVWIVRILFVIAVFAPVIDTVQLKLNSDAEFMVFFLVCLLFLEFGDDILLSLLSAKYYNYAQVLILTNIGYCLVFLFGLRIHRFTGEQIKNQIIFWGSLFVLYALAYSNNCEGFTVTQQYKYPPRIYYISYAIMVTLCFYYLMYFTKRFSNVSYSKAIQFIGSSTLWIYFWHWVFLLVFNSHIRKWPFWGKYLTIYICSVVTVYLQFFVIRKAIKLMKPSMKVKIFIEKMLTG